MKTWLNPVLACLLASGCARVMRSLKVPTAVESSPSKEETLPISCARPAVQGTALVGPSTEAQHAFQSFLRQAGPTHKFSFEEQVVLWTLFQVKVRPDFASPTARLQFLSRTRLGTRYWDFGANGDDETEHPFLRALDAFLEAHGIKRPLTWYARLLDARFTQGIAAGRALEQHLLKLQKGIAANAVLRQHWFRGDELLRENERLPQVPLVPLVTLPRPRGGAPASPLFPYRKTPSLDVRCNYDLTLYDNSIFLIDKEENDGHLFGLTHAQGAFLAVAAQKSVPPRPLAESPVFRGSAKVRSAAFCVVQRPTGEIWLAANHSRDPGQHVYHLFRYGMGRTDSPGDLERLVRHARHMFLSDPLRLVIESARSRDEQVRELLKLNVPIYNATAIGNIWAWSRFGDEAGGRFTIDDRNPGALLCPP